MKSLKMAKTLLDLVLNYIFAFSINVNEKKVIRYVLQLCVITFFIVFIIHPLVLFILSDYQLYHLSQIIQMLFSLATYCIMFNNKSEYQKLMTKIVGQLERFRRQKVVRLANFLAICYLTVIFVNGVSYFIRYLLVYNHYTNNIQPCVIMFNYIRIITYNIWGFGWICISLSLYVTSHFALMMLSTQQCDELIKVSPFMPTKHIHNRLLILLNNRREINQVCGLMPNLWSVDIFIATLIRVLHFSVLKNSSLEAMATIKLLFEYLVILVMFFTIVFILNFFDSKVENTLHELYQRINCNDSISSIEDIKISILMDRIIKDSHKSLFQKVTRIVVILSFLLIFLILQNILN